MLSITHESIRQAFTVYHNLPALAVSSLAQSPLVTQMLWTQNNRSSYSFALATRCLLDWGLEHFIEKGNKTALLSYETLDKRYRQQLSVSAYAQESDLFEQTIQKRRKAATRKLAALFEHEQDNPIFLSHLQAQVIEAHIQRLKPDEYRLLCLLSLLNKPLKDIQELSTSVQIDIQTVSVQGLSSNNLIVINADHAILVHPAIKEHILQSITLRERIVLCSQLAHFYEQKQHMVQAIYYFLNAREQPNAARLFAELSNNQIQASLETLSMLMAQFEEEALSKDAWLRVRYIAGIISRASLDVNKSLAEYEIALATDDPILKTQIHYHIADIYRELVNYDASLMHIKMGKNVLKMEQPEEAAILLANLYILETTIYLSHIGDYDMAYKSLQEAEIIITTITNSTNKVLLHLQSYLSELWGNYYWCIDNLNEAIEHYMQSRIYALECNDTKRKMATNLYLGQVYTAKNNYEEAFRYYYEALNMAQEDDDNQSEAGIHIELGACLYKSTRVDEAIPYLNRAYQYGHETNNDYMLSLVLGHLTHAHIMRDEIEFAVNYYKELCVLGEKVGHRESSNFEFLLDLVRKDYPFIEEDINERQFRGLLYLQEHKMMKRQQYVALSEVGTSTATQDLNQLVEMGWCERHGRGRGVRYMWIPREKEPEKDALQAETG